MAEVKVKFIHELDNIIIRELNKCQVLCSNCHQENHIDKDRFIKYKIDILNKVDNYKEKQGKLDTQEIYRLYDNGNTQSNIAKINASKGTISDIIKKREPK